MDFFQAQDQARRRTGFLLLLFLAALAGTVAVLYGILFIAFGDGIAAVTGIDSSSGSISSIGGYAINTDLLLDITIGVLALVSVGSLYKILTLHGDSGGKIARSLGGRKLVPDTRIPDERRLLNTVGEMAVAAGAPMPDVYLLPDEHINAFAAGTTPHNAVIGVTRGAVRQLTRDQLQGVMAHEFSHIMNGDMRLNIRLIAVIHGIMLLGYIGYFILRSSLWVNVGRSSRDSNTAWLPLLGLALIVAGFLGTFFGSWIRAAVSRQREYLADAAAVQYTRNPEGIAGALERIGMLSGTIAARAKQRASAENKENGEDKHVVEYAHMLFSRPQLSGLSSPFATHPPLDKRIKRLLPQWDENTPINTSLPPQSPATTPEAAARAAAARASSATMGFADSGGSSTTTAGILAAIGNPTPASLKGAAALMQQLPADLLTATENPYSARALIYILLLDKNDDTLRGQQLAHIASHADTGVCELVLKLIPAADTLPAGARLPLVQHTLPSLRLLSPQQYQLFLTNVEALVAIDSKIELFEWCLQAIIVHDLHDHFSGARRQYGDRNKTRAMGYALSLLARVGQEHPAAAVDAAATATELKLKYTEDAFQPQRLFDAMQTIGTLPPKTKARFVHAATTCAAHNGKIDSNEATLLRAYFMLLDCPLPLQPAEYTA